MAATRRNRPADRSERPFGPVSGLCFALLMLAAVAGPCAAQGWPEHGGPGGIHYSSLAQIDRSNVHELVLAWTYRTGEGAGPLTEAGHFGLQVTPILLPEAAGGHLVLCSPLNRVIALDPATGRERWRFDPEVRRLGPDDQPKCRGVAQWRDAELDAGALCAWRIFVATLDQRLLALDGRTGRACESFGQDGVVELAAFIDATMPATDTASVRTYMPPAIISDKVIVGSSVGAKFRRADAPSGAVRAFDARTGRLAWSFDAVPRTADDPAAADWTPEAQKQTGGANVWSLMSVDPGRDMVFLPTSSASPNFFGGTRPGNNRHANSVVALRGSTGELVWSFQLVHHDVWDWDVASQPLLVDLQRNGQRIPVVVQLTKQGLVFVFHRETGVPVFPVEERPVPVDGVPGDALSPTQPFPVAPPPLAPMSIEPDDAWGFSFYDRLACRRMIEALRHGEAYTPPTVRGTVIRSGMVSNWGAGAFDESRNVLITNAQSLPSLIRLVPDDQVEAGQTDAPVCPAALRAALPERNMPCSGVCRSYSRPSARLAPGRRGTAWWRWTWRPAVSIGPFRWARWKR